MGKDSIGEGKGDGANTLDQWLKQSGIIGLEKGSNQGLGTPIVKYLKYSWKMMSQCSALKLGGQEWSTHVKIIARWILLSD